MTIRFQAHIQHGLKLWLLLVFVYSLCIATTTAHTPILNATSPIGFERGNSATVHLHGKFLSKARALLFYHKGITAGAPVIHNDKHVSFPLTIAKNCPLGEHPIRLHCADGVTYQRTLWVTPNKVFNETAENNNSAEVAQEIPLNSCVRGIAKTEDVDFYKVRLAKNQRLSVELFAMRLGKSFFDAHLSIYAPNFRALATSDDTALSKQDPYLSIVAQSDGFHYLAVREASYEGSDKSHYLLHVGDFFRPAVVFPPGAKPNEPVNFTLINEDGSSLNQESSLSTPHIFAANTQNRTPIAPNPVRLSPLHFFNEKEPNDRAKQASPPQSIPFAFHGIIHKPGDIDWFTFSAKKNQDIRIQVYARSLGSPLDARVTLCDPKGKYLASNDDSNHPDSKLDHKIPEDGIYSINIRDHLGKGGPHFTYRIEITKRTPSIAASLNRADRNDSQKYKVINIPQGAHLAYKLNVSRDRNSAALQPHAKILPKGVKLQTITASKDLTNIPLHFSATADAPLSAQLNPLTLRSEDGKLEAPVTETIEHIFINNQGIFHAYQSDRLSICVTEKAPFSITLTEPTVPAVQSGTIELEIHCARAEGFDKDITLFFPWLPPGISAKGSVKLPKGKNTIKYRLTVNGDCKPQVWQLCVSATADSKSGLVHLSSNLVPLSVKPPYLQAQLEMAATTQGADTSIVCKIEHSTPFEGEGQLTLHGLPDGLTSAPMQITKDTKELLIPITVKADARTGKHANLFCHIRIPEKSDSIAHITGHGGSLRVDPPTKNTVKQTPAKEVPKGKAPKKPLSRLEQLRLEQKQNNKTSTSK